VGLGPDVAESGPNADAVTHTPPVGWSVDNSQMPSGGVTEWRGWSFADPAWWVEVSQDQGRSGFTRASAVTAIADPDEWKDAATGSGTFESTLITRPIDLSGLRAGSALVVVNSSWRPEGAQRALIEVSFDGGARRTLAEFSSNGGDANFKPEAVNEELVLDLGDTSGVQEIRLFFTLKDAGNNWWWAIDDVRVIGEPAGRRVTLLQETFEGVALGEPVYEPSFGGGGVWTDVPPVGWEVDDSGVIGVADPALGVEEWEGWAFADFGWWRDVAADQGRSGFVAADGVIAIADPDEWDDLGGPELLGSYETTLRTPVMDVRAIRPGTLRVSFDSSWRYEDTQSAMFSVVLDSVPSVLFEWHSVVSSPFFKADAVSERVEVSVPHALVDEGVLFEWRMFDARNDWWWAIDDILVVGECFLDANADRVTDFVDVLVMLSRTEGGDVLADLDVDGDADAGDLLAFVGRFELGCP